MSAAPLPYETQHIRVLPWRDAVRTRPAMYVGSSGPQGAAHLVHEILQNSVDEALAGAATEIWLRLLPDGAVEIEDDGRGVPLEPVPGLDRSALEVVLTTLHAGGKFDQRSYAVAGDTMQWADRRIRLMGIDAPANSQTCPEQDGAMLSCGQLAGDCQARRMGGCTSCATRRRCS